MVTPTKNLSVSLNLRTVAISKFVATGNDFLFLDGRDGLPEMVSHQARSQLAVKLCDRHFGVGADGLVIVENSDVPSRLKWDFYNSDGSHAEMCGNASRCMGKWAEKFLSKNEVQFETAAGLVRVTVDHDQVASELTYLKLEIKTISYKTQGVERRAHFVNTGVPHAVVEIARIDQVAHHIDDVRALRFHPDVGPRGTNVTFLEKHSANQFSTVTYERGVEDFTLSCGTGVLAAAAVGLMGSQETYANVVSPGGAFEVHCLTQQGGIVLRGPASFLFEVNLTEEFF